jgi:hypothetical protein
LCLHRDIKAAPNHQKEKRNPENLTHRQTPVGAAPCVQSETGAPNRWRTVSIHPPALHSRRQTDPVVASDQFSRLECVSSAGRPHPDRPCPKHPVTGSSLSPHLASEAQPSPNLPTQHRSDAAPDPPPDALRTAQRPSLPARSPSRTALRRTGLRRRAPLLRVTLRLSASPRHARCSRRASPASPSPAAYAALRHQLAGSVVWSSASRIEVRNPVPAASNRRLPSEESQPVR